MARLFLIMAVVSAVFAGCGADTATQERPSPPTMRAETVSPPAAVTVPDNPVDRDIRRDLTLTIGRDADLQHREISFIVSNGDVTVTGIVRTEEERRKINSLVMNIDGVKSVANALKVAEWQTGGSLPMPSTGTLR